MNFPASPKEGQTYQEPALTTVQRHAVKDAVNALRSVGLEPEARFLDSRLEEPTLWTFSDGSWRVPALTQPVETSPKRQKKPPSAA